MRRMSHYLGFYTEILSTKVGIKRSGLIELITIVQVYDHLPTGESTRSSPDKVRLEVVNIAGMYSQARPGQECFYKLTYSLGLLLAGRQVFSIIVSWLDSQGTARVTNHVNTVKTFITFNIFSERFINGSLQGFPWGGECPSFSQF